MNPPPVSAAALSGPQQRFLDTAIGLLRDGQPPQSLAALIDTTYRSIDGNCAHAPARPCGHTAFLVDQSMNLVALLELEADWPPLDLRLPLATAAAERLKALHRRSLLLHRGRCPRRPYAQERCGSYPFRDATHEEVRVLDAADSSKAARSGQCYRFAEAEPFVRATTRRAARAALYRDRLAVRRLKAADLQLSGEESLIGQWGVFASVGIPAGTCLGVYGGQLLRDRDWLLLPDDRYLLAMDAQGTVRLDGETLLSLANTLYLDAQALVQADDGYNAELARFPARLAYGWEACVPALFALHDIAPGEEIRWHYGIARA